MSDAVSTKLRIPKDLNDRLKAFAEILDCSVTDLATRSLTAICDMLDGDDRPPLLVEEYKLKKRYKETDPKKKK